MQEGSEPKMQLRQKAFDLPDNRVCVCVNIRSYIFMSLNFMAALTSISKLPHFSNIYFFRVLCRESTNLIAQKFGPKTKNAEMSKFLVCGFFD